MGEGRRREKGEHTMQWSWWNIDIQNGLSSVFVVPSGWVTKVGTLMKPRPAAMFTIISLRFIPARISFHLNSLIGLSLRDGFHVRGNSFFVHGSSMPFEYASYAASGLKRTF